jgi:hypothetical protein
MNPVEWAISAVKAFGSLYRWLVKDHLRDRSEEMARSVRTASVIRGGSVKLRWHEWPAARALQREGHGTICEGYYQTWVNVTPPAILMALAARAPFQSVTRSIHGVEH